MADSIQAKIAELEAKRAEALKAVAELRAEQYAKDLEAIIPIEVEHGADRVVMLRMPSFVAGLPTLVLVKTPSPAHFNRYRQMVRKSGKDLERVGAAADMLADVCVAYPDADTYAKMREAWPSLHDDVAVHATRLGESEGKG